MYTCPSRHSKGPSWCPQNSSIRLLEDQKAKICSERKSGFQHRDTFPKQCTRSLDSTDVNVSEGFDQQENFIRFLVTELKIPKQSTKADDKKLYFAREESCFKMTKDQLVKVKDLKSNQEEADTRIYFTCSPSWKGRVQCCCRNS